jgi:hypothetical protein
MSGFLRSATWMTLACLGLLVGCHNFKVPGVGGDKADKVEKEEDAAQPGKYSLRVSQYVFYSDFEIKRDLPIFRELSDLREQLFKELQLPAPASDTLIHVYLFSERDSYERFMQTRYKKLNLPNRRAFFLEEEPHGLGKGELLVYTFWSKRINLDLRHELTHALLHSVLKEVPLWLDEGLAEYYELPPSWNGLNRAHAQALQNEGVHPDLARLERLSAVTDMNTAEYREAWAWVYLMLRADPQAKDVLLAYLQQLRKLRVKEKPPLLQPRLAEAVPGVDNALARLLAQLADDGRRDRR